ncbi:MAG: hypothetical protein BWZ09_02527 [Alphaproteobacteria bacterium ADurb.BinA305]|nr:MAG: hypothetical protein BWZ09_02527 [Alphaproteobacteria bacterium ADurb.BinA305]
MRRVGFQREVIVGVGVEHALVGEVCGAALGHDGGRPECVLLAEAGRIGRAQVAAHQARAVEGVQRGQVEELEIPPGGEHVAAGRSTDREQPEPGRAEVHRALGREHRPQRRRVHKRDPPRAQQEAEYVAGELAQAQQQLAADSALGAATQRRHRRPQHGGGHRQGERGIGLRLELEGEEPRHPVHQSEQQHDRDRLHAQGLPVGQPTPHRLLAEPQRIALGLVEEVAQQEARPRDRDQPGDGQADRAPGQRHPDRMTGLPLRTDDGVAVMHQQAQDDRQDHALHGDEAGPPSRPPGRRHPGHDPVRRGRQAAEHGQHRDRDRPQRGQPGGQPAQGLDALARHPPVRHPVRDRRPHAHIDRRQHHAEREGQRAELEVDREQVAQEDGEREGLVGRSARHQVAAVGAQPPAKPAWLLGAEGREDGAGVVRGACAVQQAAEHAADVAAAGHGRQQVEAFKQAVAREHAEQAEAEGRAADAAARQGQAPFVRDAVLAPEGRAPFAHQLVDLLAHGTVLPAAGAKPRTPFRAHSVSIAPELCA